MTVTVVLFSLEQQKTVVAKTSIFVRVQRMWETYQETRGVRRVAKVGGQLTPLYLFVKGEG